MNTLALFFTINYFLAFCAGGPPLQLPFEENDPNLSVDFQKRFQVPEQRFRLPHSVIPTNYNIKIRPILDDLPEVGAQWSAPGTVIISAQCVQATTNITLHSLVDVTESSVKVTRVSNGEDVPNLTFSEDPTKDFFIISFATPLVAGEDYTIYIDYLAQVGIDRLDGLYRSHYIDPVTKETKYLAATQFQAFGARKAFPCFDEPEFKATFDTTIGHRKTAYNVYCNTPVNTITQDPDHADWQWVKFDQTVPMPTYLVAMVISDFTAAEAPPGIYHKDVQTIGPKHQIDAGLGDYTAKVAAQHLAHFEEYFVEEYSLDKMDSAALVDFAAGAMENWGLNTYREAYLMYSKEENTENERRGMSSVLAHELAHQWFGNLITCKWWNDAWLNEGFASYIQFLGMRNATPEFEPMKVRLTESFHAAMRSDVLENSHPTQLPDKGNPYDTMNYLAALVYSKGSAIIRMMEQFLTEKTLQVGLQKFLKKYSFKPVEQDELFEVLNEQAHLDNMLPEGVTIKQIMDTWTLQRGYPLVRVYKAGSTRIYITQEKFVNKGQTFEDFKYYIPVAVATQDDPDFSDALPDFWIPPSTDLLNMDNYDTSKWIILNAGATGYYRVLYDKSLTDLIVKQLNENHELIEHGSRTQLIDDYFNFGFEGYAKIDHALDMTVFLNKETEYTVWVPALFHLRKLYNLFTGSDFDQFKNYFLPKISEALDTIGLEQQTTDIGNLVIFRSQLLDWACGFQHPGCVTYATRVWNEWKATPAENKVPIDLRPVLYCAAIRAGGQPDIDFALSQYALESTPLKQKQWIINALGCTIQDSSLTDLLEKSIDASSGIAKSEAIALVRAIAGNILGRGLVMDFLEARLDAIIDYMGNAGMATGAISTMSTYLQTEGDKLRIQSFLDTNMEKLSTGEQNSLKSSIANIEANRKWLEDNKAAIIQWLFFSVKN